jgi:DNA-binding MarR family transcriptional regulator
MSRVIDHQTARRLRDAVRHLVVAHGVLEETRRPCGTTLPIARAYALLELAERGVPMTVSELAERLAIDRTNVSRLCARMEKAGELLREPHPHDGRARALTLTAHGKRLARGVDASSARHFAGLVERLGGEAERVIEALRLLETTMASLENEGQ